MIGEVSLGFRVFGLRKLRLSGLGLDRAYVYGKRVLGVEEQPPDGVVGIVPKLIPKP